MNKKNVEILTEKTILYMGIPIKMTGYGYICEAVYMTLENRETVPSITKEIYPVIAKKNRVSTGSVEKCIRHAIEHAWDSDNAPIREFLYEHAAGRSERRPTNSEFISLLAWKIGIESDKFI